MSIIKIKQVSGLPERLDGLNSSLKITLIQNNHNFSEGKAISYFEQNWVLANSNDENKLGRVIVESIIDSNTFVGVLSGVIEITNFGLIPSTYYFVGTNGNLTTSTDGLEYSNPILQAITNEIAHVLPWRASLIFVPIPELVQEFTQEEIPSSTSGDFSSTGITLTFKPINNSTVQVYLNGSALIESYGNRLGEVYFSSDGGITAKAVNEINSGDILYWNGNIVGFNLDINDRISIVYHKNSSD